MGEAGRAAVGALTRESGSGGKIDLDKVQAQRDAELRTILSGQPKK